tara:strand:+ start:605 stop:739 length:135 start_codon:yes stop_codon:yes gene_type:complete
MCYILLSLYVPDIKVLVEDIAGSSKGQSENVKLRVAGTWVFDLY